MDFYIDINQIEEQFLDFMRFNNCEPEGLFSLQMDGQIHRYRVKGDKHSNKSGAYCVFTDNWPAGWCMDWHNGEAISWCFNRDSLNDEQKQSLSEKKYQELFKQSQAHQAEMRKQQAQLKADASERARILVEQLPEADKAEDHPYIHKKQIYSYGLKIDRDSNALVIPLRNIDGQIVSLQWIYQDGEKRFYPNATKKGNFFSISLETVSKDEPILIGEGVATMSTVYELTGLPCIAAMDCGNIKPVAEAVKKKFPDNPIIIMADNDHKTKDNPGKNTAEKVCKELNLNGYVLPAFSDNQDGSDWNDFYAIHGEDETTQKLKAEINDKRLTPEQKQEKAAREKLADFVKELDPSIKLAPQEFIGNMFARGFISAIVAPPGIGKTLFMQKFVSDLTIGGSVFNGFADDEPPRMCLIFAGEAGYEMMLRRGASTKWAINPKRAKVVDSYEFEHNDISVMLDDEEGWLNIQRLVDMFKPDVVFFDSLVSFHSRDENKAVDMKPIIKRLEKLARNSNIAVVLIHHSRKRTAKERSLSLNQDDVIGSSVFNRLVATIIGIEPMKEDEGTLLVRPLKTWFNTFMPFTYKITEDLYGNTVVQTDLAPASVNNSKIIVWNYLIDNFDTEEWFTTSQIILSEMSGNITERQLRHILASFVESGKLQRRGIKKSLEYAIQRH